jgi:hypothetical protein
MLVHAPATAAVDGATRSSVSKYSQQQQQEEEEVIVDI